jgi:hypothetical protein
MEDLTLHQQHADPFVLTSDLCGYCQKNMAEERIPCSNCLGHLSYCSENCLWQHYPRHNAECSKFVRKFIPMRHEYMQRQHRMFGPARGYPELLRHAMANLDYSVLRENMFFIRLPLDTTSKFRTTHPIKKIPRQGCVNVLSKSPLFKRVWKAFVEHAASTTIDHFYFFCYTSNLSVCVMTAVPYEPQASLESAQMPYTQVLPCPCHLHTATSST